MFETLETRRLMSGTTFTDGSSVVLGSTGVLTISSPASGSNLMVMETSGTVLVQNMITGQSTSAVGALKIKINGNRGNDTINYRGNSIGAAVVAGAGTDNVTILDQGLASSTVDAGQGNDVVNVVFSLKAKIGGGGGNDVITVNTGVGYDFSQTDISVDGGSGNDDIYFYAGHATIYGGNGSDTLHDLSGGLGSLSYRKIELVLNV